MSTEIAPRDGAVLFAGATPREIVDAATEAANELHQVITDRQLFTRIGKSEHVRVEGWQTLGTMVGVFAVQAGGVEALPWPIIPNDGLPGPPDPGREPMRSSPEWPVWKQVVDRAVHWEEQQTLIRARDRGLTFGFKASFRAVKDGREVGWGESRCVRSEKAWVNRDDYAVSSMAQTRAQSKALRQPLGFIVGLAGFNATPAEEITEPAAEVAAPAVLDEDHVRDCAHELQSVWPDFDAHSFMRVLARRFDGGVPEAAGVALRAWAWWAGRAPQSELNASQEGSEGPQSASESPIADQD